MRLSELQRVILRLAIENRANGRAGKADVSPTDVKRVYYRLTENPRGTKIHFSRNAIGIARYNSIAVTISRSFVRLVASGLAEKSYYGLRLTIKGEAVAIKYLTSLRARKDVRSTGN